MSKPKLHLDADASQKALLQALLDRGHDVTRIPHAGLPRDADDDFQLLWATRRAGSFLHIISAILSNGHIIIPAMRGYC